MAKYKKIARFHPYMVYVWSIPDLALKVFVCVSVISGHMQIIARMQSISILIAGLQFINHALHVKFTVQIYPFLNSKLMLSFLNVISEAIFYYIIRS